MIPSEDQVCWNTGYYSMFWTWSLWLTFPAWYAVELTMKVIIICPFGSIDPTNLGQIKVVVQDFCLTIFNSSIPNAENLPFTDGNATGSVYDWQLHTYGPPLYSCFRLKTEIESISILCHTECAQRRVHSLWVLGLHHHWMYTAITSGIICYLFRMALQSLWSCGMITHHGITFQLFNNCCINWILLNLITTWMWTQLLKVTRRFFPLPNLHPKELILDHLNWRNI